MSRTLYDCPRISRRITTTLFATQSLARAAFIACGTVSALVAKEPVPITTAAERRQRTSRLGPFAGAALAASAAFFAVFAVPQLFDTQPTPSPPAVARVSSPPPEQFLLPNPTQRWVA